MGYVIVKTNSHRAYNRVRSIPGAFGPYWKPGKDRFTGEASDSIMDRVDAEFWLVPKDREFGLIGHGGVAAAPRAKVEELGRFLFGSGSTIPAAIDVVEGRI